MAIRVTQQIIRQGVHWVAPVNVGEGIENKCIHQTEAPVKA